MKRLSAKDAMVGHAVDMQLPSSAKMSSFKEELMHVYKRGSIAAPSLQTQGYASDEPSSPQGRHAGEDEESPSGVAKSPLYEDADLSPQAKLAPGDNEFEEDRDYDEDLPTQIIPPMPDLQAAEPVIRLPSAMKALRTELTVLQRELDAATCRVHLADADLFNWEVELTGPKGSPYQGGTFRFLLHFPVDYPKHMPRIRCATPIFHCNIDASGSVCIGPFDEEGLSPTALVPRSDDCKHHSFDRPQLRVRIVSARGLRNADFGGKSDPYCTCIIPGKSWSQFQTAIINDTLNPVWNEEHVINDFEPGDSLDFTVWDDDDGPLLDLGQDELLGRGNLDSAAFYPEGFDGDITLLDTGKNQRSTLKVKVTVLNPRRQQDRATALDVVEALLSVLALPVLDRPLVPANARMFREDRRRYDHLAREWTLRHAL